MENSNGKKTLGRRKIPMRKIEKKSSLQVAFTKRRGGLFRKATELSILCGAEVAILVQSPAQKLYAFGHPSVAALIDRIDPIEAAMKMLEAEKRRSTEKEIKGGDQAAFSSNQVKINDHIIPTYTLDQIWGRD
ncbi:hypothetical protein SASPL_124242 [Salvia splendens]|uniref:MADS-box domain-containing protein n=1 Tax=Salvia splendens TaxID=180675 RepID=A0A8X8ZTR8_SALSN|nr:agamous-like MADS-box protein AGL61 [Salvia splendens]KAG6416802.1 hypothetical protein SASPL_124242 [Salvia splendens]